MKEWLDRAAPLQAVIIAIFAAVFALGLESCERASAQPPLMQVGPWYPAPYNVEEPYLNVINASSVSWSADGLSTQDLYDQGVIDPQTGLPVRLPDGKWLRSGGYFSGGDLRAALGWDGEWVLEWEGDADLWVRNVPNDLQWRSSPNRIEFTIDRKRGKTRGAVIEVRKIKTPITALRLYRKKHEALLRAGKILNPDFAAAISRYDVVRTMDLQSAGTAIIRSVDDLPGANAPFWGNRAWRENKTRHYFRSAPIEAMTALAIESDTALWAIVPITLGATVDFHDASVKSADNAEWALNFAAVARKNASAILASPEWDRYADRLVSALINSGYPEDRPLYLALENEVWNTAGQYFATTSYAGAIGKASGVMGRASGGETRIGYGVLSARWKLAFDRALARAGRKQNVVYVLEGQQAWAQTTAWAIAGAKRWLEKQGEKWADHAPGFGVSVASYWGGGAGERILQKASAADFPMAAEDYLLNGSARDNGSLAMVVEKFSEHARIAAAEGVRFIGAYEGGSHLTRPDSLSKKDYEAFMYGEPAGRVNRAVTDALAAKFPGIIVSNYVLAGSRGAPWSEGPLGDRNPYRMSWEPYLRPEKGEGARP